MSHPGNTLIAQREDAGGAMMELREIQHQRSLVHTGPGTKLLIRGFKAHHADQTQNSDLSRNHARYSG